MNPLDQVFLQTALHDVSFASNPPVLVPADVPNPVRVAGPYLRILLDNWIAFRKNESPNTTTRWTILDPSEVDPSTVSQPNQITDEQLIAAKAAVEEDKK